MNKNTLKFIGLLIMFFCVFQLGRIHEETQHLKRIDKCVKLLDNTDLKTFYGHEFTDVSGNLWNHALGHNANIYLKCIFKDIKR